MNLSKLPDWQKGLILLVVIVSVFCLIFFQVESSATATKTESMLFNVLQFIFSILFAWLLSAFASESQFMESQRKFAIGAFRRIKEIERSINRTKKYVAYLEKGADELTRSKVIAINGGLSAMQDTVRSSIADWSDIIGDEIHISNEIKRLKRLKIEDEDKAQSSEDEFDKKYESEIDTKISALVESLPIEIANDLRNEDDLTIEEGTESLAFLWSQDECLNLYCFWEPNSGFGADLSGLEVGNRLYLSRGLTESRPGALMLFNENDKQIAVVTNACLNECSYGEFVDAFENFYGRIATPKSLGGNPFTVKILEIEAYEHDKERQYFTVTVEQSPKHECVFESIENRS